MRSDTMHALISDLESENIDSLTDTAVGEDIIELRRFMDRIESVDAPAPSRPPSVARSSSVTKAVDSRVATVRRTGATAIT